jgi:hypothetical protein
MSTAVEDLRRWPGFSFAHKHPLRVASAEKTPSKHLICDNVGNLVFSQAVFRLLSIERNELATAKLNQGEGRSDQR